MTSRSARRVLAAALSTCLLVSGCGLIGEDDASSAEPTTRPTKEPAPLPSPTGADPALAAFYTQALTWSGCGGGFECTTVEVPLDYDDAAAHSIELSVVRQPAGDPANRVGSLLVNPGGPGGSGVDYVRAARAVFTQPVQDSYDLIGFDPRGVKASTPVDCVSDEDLDEFISADQTPDDAAEEQSLLSVTRAFVAGCGARSAELLPNIGTEDAARDMDIMRALLGDEQLNYLGASYGTFLGATYAGLFPDKVGRLVLDGAVSPSVSGAELGRIQAVGFEKALDAFLADCFDQDDCPLDGPTSKARTQITDFLEQVDAEPLPGIDDRELTESLAWLGILVTLYDEQSGWPALRGSLGQALDDGEGAGLLTLADIYTDRRENGTYDGNQNEVSLAVNCFDRPVDLTPEQVAADAQRYAAESPIFGEWIGWSELACAEWPVAGPGPAAITAPGAKPILVVGTTRDPATPYEWSVELAAQLESGVLLTYDGDGHTAYNRGSDCVDATVEAFLVSDVVPADGKRC